MESSVKATIDLLWVRPKQVGGIESYIRNLLDGFSNLEDNFEFWLLVSKDNAETFEKYASDSRFHLHICEVYSANVGKRVIWQNLHLGNEIKKLGLSECFEPYYCKPVFGTNGISFVTTIHDLQAIHYPKYFSKGKVAWMKFSWGNAIKTSKKVVAISEYVKDDIIENYKVTPDKIVAIYNPITVDMNAVLSVEEIERKYGIKNKEFFFTVSSLLPHKNLGVLLDVIKKINDENLPLPKDLIISGIGGKSRGELEEKIREYGLEAQIKLTPFIDDAERNALYKYSYAFLFPSIFEGFGMPPIEAILFGTPVVTTKKTCLEEVTQGSATYVDDPHSAEEWIDKIKHCGNGSVDFSVYEKKSVARKYLEVLSNL